MPFPAYATPIFPGFNKKRASAVSRTPMEDGMVKQLKTKSRVLVTRKVIYRLASAADYASFITWYRVTINEGADWFDWTDPEDGQVKLARIVNELGDEKPQRKSFDRWLVDLSIETWST